MRTTRCLRVRLLVLVTVLLLAPRGLAEGPRRVTSIEGITQYELDNGLSVLLFPDPSQATVTVNVTYLVGSRHEGAGEGGMAHLLEHLLFKGTPTHPDIPKSLKDRGAQSNGTTSSDRTNYFETLPAGDDNLQFALRLEGDRMVNSFVRQEDLDSEMTVVRNEFERAENSPEGVLYRRVLAVAYDWHNYGKPTIGNRSDIERVPIDKLKAFYKKYYQPDNAVLVVSGRFDEAKALAWIQQYFGVIPRPDRKLEPTYTMEPPKDGQRTVELRRVGDVALVIMVHHIPAGAHPDCASVDVLSNVLTTEPSGRLYKALVETRKAIVVRGFARGQHDPGLFLLFALVRPGVSPEEIRDILLAELKRVGEQGVRKEEVERARRQILNARERALANSTQSAIRLSEWAAQGDWRLFFLYRDRIEEVTPERVHQVAQKYLVPNNRTIGMYIPTKEPERVAIPATPDVDALVRDYKGREEIAAGEQLDVSPAGIEARTLRETLPSGIKAALLPKKTRGQTVHLRLILRYGDAENLKGMQEASYMMAPLMQQGTESLTREQLQDELDKHAATLRASGGLGGAFFTMQTKREELPAALEILRQVLREATLPEKWFVVLKKQSLAGMERMRSEPRFLASLRLGRLLSPYPENHVLYVPTLDERIQRLENVSVDQVRKLYQDYLGGRHGELAIVGDFDPDQVRPLLAKMLDGWKAKVPYERIERRVFPDVGGSTHTILTPDKANAEYRAGLQFALRDTDPDYAAMSIGGYVFGASSLASRLGDRVRQKEGLSYSVGANISAGSRDAVGSLTMQAIVNPNNVPKLQAIMREELEKLVRDGITEDELQRARKALLERRKVTWTNDASLVGVLVNTLDNERTMQYYADLEEGYEALTPDAVADALRRYIDPKRLVVVTAGDFQSPSAGESEKRSRRPPR